MKLSPNLSKQTMVEMHKKFVASLVKDSQPQKTSNLQDDGSVVQRAKRKLDDAPATRHVTFQKPNEDPSRRQSNRAHANGHKKRNRTTRSSANNEGSDASSTSSERSAKRTRSSTPRKTRNGRTSAQSSDDSSPDIGYKTGRKSVTPLPPDSIDTQNFPSLNTINERAVEKLGEMKSQNNRGGQSHVDVTRNSIALTRQAVDKYVKQHFSQNDRNGPMPTPVSRSPHKDAPGPVVVLPRMKEPSPKTAKPDRLKSFLDEQLHDRNQPSTSGLSVRSTIRRNNPSLRYRLDVDSQREDIKRMLDAPLSDEDDSF